MAKKLYSNQPLFTFEGLDINGKPIKIENLTYAEAQELEKQEQEGVRRRESEETMGPALEKEISTYDSTRNQPQQSSPDIVPESRGISSSIPSVNEDSVISSLDNIQSSRQGENTRELESVLSAIPSPQQEGPMREFDTGIQTQVAEQPPSALTALLEGIPEDLIRPLIFQRQNDPKSMPASKFLTEVRKIREEIGKIKQAKEAEEFKSGIRMKEQEQVGEQQEDLAIIGGEYGLERQRIANQAAWIRKNDTPEQKLGDFDKKIRRDPIILGQYKVLAAGRDLQKMLQSDNPITAEVFGTKMAKLSGEVGNLALQEQQQYKGSQALWSRFKQTLKKAGTGQLTDENKAYALELVNMYYGTAQSVVNERMESIATAHSIQTDADLDTLRSINKAYGSTIDEEETETTTEISGTPDASGFIVGQIYKDAQGNSAKYMGNGEWREQ